MKLKSFLKQLLAKILVIKNNLSIDWYLYKCQNYYQQKER